LSIKCVLPPRSAMAAAPPAPLHGILVVDMTHVVAGPHCTRVLCDLGARVIKVETKEGGSDMLRYFQPRVAKGDLSSDSAYFAQVNAGKESIVLDIEKKAEDREVFEQLLAEADVLVENWRPGKLERIGYNWEMLHAKYPRLIVCSISGFGQTGPYRNFTSVDTITQAMSGFVNGTGFPDQPVKVGTTISDFTAGVYGVVGIQAALLSRTTTGLGRYVDISMLDASFAYHAREFSIYQVLGKEPERMGNATTVSPAMGIYQCADGKYIAVAGGHDPEVLGVVLQAPEIGKDPRFQTYELMMHNHLALKEAMDAAIRRKPRSEWLQYLRELGAPAGPVNDMRDLSGDPQLAHRRMLRASKDGRFTLVGNPVKMTGLTDPEVVQGPPIADEHGAAIRAELKAKRQSKL